ncbi:MAG TPA: ATP-binding protein, partial [Cytophagaceae bacterium]|nr:ATP-binding protein [Cytophagaceae bacterium]
MEINRIEINKRQHIDFRVLLESVPGLFLILFPDLTIAAVSDAYLETTLTKRKEMIGQKLIDIFPDNPDDKRATGESHLLNSLNIVLQKRIPHTMEIQKYLIPKSDSTFEERFWSFVNKPILNSDQEISYIIHTVEDVTQFILMKKEEAEKIKKNEELRTHISQMEIEICKSADKIQKTNSNLIKEINERISIEKTLEENRIRLDAANKELEAFTYSVSHDLRAPLRSINGYTKVLFEDYHDKFDEGGKKIINTIIRNAKKMEHLMEDLLLFSQLGKIDLVKTEIDMNHLVHSVITDLKKDDSNNYPEIEIQNLKPAFVNKSTMKQVWVNLISNAIKYSATKTKTIIQIGFFTKDNNNVYFIKDNGIGFDMQYAHKLFGVFQRLHSMGEFEGTGVGLAIIKRIILRHGGTVWAEGEPNKGATFY